jgi:hydrogenase maturation protease
VNRSLVEKVADALLYEGYLLYPYRASSVKNQQRWTFGGVYPESWSRRSSTDACVQQTQVLVRCEGRARFAARVRFLHLVERHGHAPGQEAIARDVLVAPIEPSRLVEHASETPFVFEADEDHEEGVARRRHALAGVVEVEAERLSPENVFRVTVRVRNRSEVDGGTREDALLRTLASTHAILTIAPGGFVSLLEPPDELREAAQACANVGTWPVLVGERGARDTMLSSPIIVYDYPEVAPESPGDLFDATEIDEILTLRILTLTEEEKAAARADPRARALLERTERLTPEGLRRLHGTLRMPPAARLRVGARVRLRPRARADVFDIALAGKTATIESIEHDLEGRVHVAVAVDDDPGRDLGLARQIGHRFFFDESEVEPL